jgi:3,4-dihydroxy 2-butanone 4-phosphate synthase/GTP cyclohydrolase II
MALTHSLRAQHDAILVGIGTILADDPQLNVRFHEGNDPQPIILDSHLRTPLTCRVVNGSNPPWIATLASSTSEKAASLLSKSVQLFHYEDRKFTQIPLDPLLSDLSRKGIMSLMVEGGAEVIQSFIASGFVDWIMLTVGPYFLDGVHAFGHRESTPLSQPVRLENLGWTRQQDDLIVWGNPEPISK